MPATITGSQNGTVGLINVGTAQSASGTAVLFTGIPSGVRRVTLLLSGVRTSGSSPPLVQIGSGSITSSGYTSDGSDYSASVVSGTSTAGFRLGGNWVSTATAQGACQIYLVSSNIYVATGWVTRTDNNGNMVTNGTVTLAGAMDRVQLTTINGTDTFSAGTLNIFYE